MADKDFVPANIVKEGNKYFVKKEIIVDDFIAEQDSIIIRLQEQINVAQVTKLELQGKK